MKLPPILPTIPRIQKINNSAMIASSMNETTLENQRDANEQDCNVE